MANAADLREEPASGRAMRVERATVPTGVERFFEREEIIVSKTDINGRITYANDVFCRIAGYTEREVIGQPHSFIRHPDMPRLVYKLLWDAIQRGDEIFAYVMNMTKSGDHYWVIAHVTPTFGEQGQILGYHSNRRCPDRSHIAFIRSVYEKLLQAERRESNKADGMAASMKVLDKLLAERGQTYEQFIFAIGRDET